MNVNILLRSKGWSRDETLSFAPSIWDRERERDREGEKERHMMTLIHFSFYVLITKHLYTFNERPGDGWHNSRPSMRLIKNNYSQEFSSSIENLIECCALCIYTHWILRVRFCHMIRILVLDYQHQKLKSDTINGIE